MGVQGVDETSSSCLADCRWRSWVNGAPSWRDKLWNRLTNGCATPLCERWKDGAARRLSKSLANTSIARASNGLLISPAECGATCQADSWRTVSIWRFSDENSREIGGL